MDIRILTLLLFISVTASFAELRSPFFRPRRDGLQENYRPLASEFAAAPRTKRESSNTTKGTTVSMSTANPSTVSLPDSKSAFSKKTDPTTEANMSDSNESTNSPTPDSSSTTGITPEPSPKTASPPTSVPRNKPKSTASEAEPTTAQSMDESTEPEATSIGSTTTPTASPTAGPITPKTTSPTSNPTTTPTTAPTTAPTTTPTSAPTTSPTTAPTTSPTTAPSTSPTTASSTSPTTAPSTSPTTAPSTSPTTAPSTSPTTASSTSPTTARSTSPTTAPSTSPTATQTTESTKPKPKRTTPDPFTESVTPKSEATSPSPTSTPKTPNPTTKPPTPKPAKSNSNTTPATTTVTPSKATTDPQTQTSSNSKNTDPPASTPAVPSFGSRFNLDDDTPVSGKSPKDAIQGPTTNPDPMPSVNQGPTVEGYPANPEFPISPFIPFFVPNFVPDFAFPSNPYSDPTFNSIPAVGNKNAWTEPNNGAGFASSFASASASAGADGNSNYNPAPLTYGGGFPEQPIADTVPATAVEPNVANVADTMPDLPGVAVAGGYGYGGDVPFFDPNSFAFPGYDMNNFQKQLMDNFQQMQNQFQRQQQAIFEASNRIGATDGFGGQRPHTAFSSINLGPRGGYEAGAIDPAAPGIESRFGQTLPAPSGNSYSVFSSSSSRTQVGPDGKTTSHKSSTTGVNDNGKITFRTVHD